MRRHRTSRAEPSPRRSERRRQGRSAPHPHRRRSALQRTHLALLPDERDERAERRGLGQPQGRSRLGRHGTRRSRRRRQDRRPHPQRTDRNVARRAHERRVGEDDRHRRHRSHQEPRLAPRRPRRLRRRRQGGPAPAPRRHEPLVALRHGRSQPPRGQERTDGERRPARGRGLGGRRHRRSRRRRQGGPRSPPRHERHLAPVRDEREERCRERRDEPPGRRRLDPRGPRGPRRRRQGRCPPSQRLGHVALVPVPGRHHPQPRRDRSVHRRRDLGLRRGRRSERRRQGRRRPARCVHHRGRQGAVDGARDERRDECRRLQRCRDLRHQGRGLGRARDRCVACGLCRPRLVLPRGQYHPRHSDRYRDHRHLLARHRHPRRGEPGQGCVRDHLHPGGQCLDPPSRGRRRPAPRATRCAT